MLILSFESKDNNSFDSFFNKDINFNDIGSKNNNPKSDLKPNNFIDFSKLQQKEIKTKNIEKDDFDNDDLIDKEEKPKNNSKKGNLNCLIKSFIKHYNEYQEYFNLNYSNFWSIKQNYKFEIKQKLIDNLSQIFNHYNYKFTNSKEIEFFPEFIEFLTNEYIENYTEEKGNYKRFSNFNIYSKKLKKELNLEDKFINHLNHLIYKKYLSNFEIIDETKDYIFKNYKNYIKTDNKLDFNLNKFNNFSKMVFLYEINKEIKDKENINVDIKDEVTKKEIEELIRLLKLNVKGYENEKDIIKKKEFFYKIYKYSFLILYFKKLLKTKSNVHFLPMEFTVYMLKDYKNYEDLINYNTKENRIKACDEYYIDLKSLSNFDYKNDLYENLIILGYNFENYLESRKSKSRLLKRRKTNFIKKLLRILINNKEKNEKIDYKNFVNNQIKKNFPKSRKLLKDIITRFFNYVERGSVVKINQILNLYKNTNDETFLNYFYNELNFNEKVDLSNFNKFKEYYEFFLFIIKNNDDKNLKLNFLFILTIYNVINDKQKLELNLDQFKDVYNDSKLIKKITDFIKYFLNKDNFNNNSQYFKAKGSLINKINFYLFNYYDLTFYKETLDKFLNNYLLNHDDSFYDIYEDKKYFKEKIEEFYKASDKAETLKKFKSNYRNILIYIIKNKIKDTEKLNEIKEVYDEYFLLDNVNDNNIVINDKIEVEKKI